MKRIGKRVAEAERKDLKGLLMSEWDRKNLQFLINFYEKAYPGLIAYHAAQARKEVEPILKQKTAKQSELNLSKRMSMPKDLLIEIKRGYPNIISDKGQFEQFLKWFPVFDLWVK